ncbi:ATP-binding cassette domain-containing protein [Kribbella sp. NPDC023855]|uniref:ATP-binding cassette domain-containing protein n=1 Tax=Kribbella sp. NPDC023855 TaxID=3154698 RepID=UPI0033E924B0
MTPAEEWSRRLDRSLIELGVEPAEARRLTEDSHDEARGAGADPSELYGPAAAYAVRLAQAVRTPQPLLSARPAGDVVLRLSRVSKRYGRQTVFNGISLTLRAGEVAAVVGANGCGKSTLLKICCGITAPSSGVVERTERIGYAPQQGGVSGFLTPAEHFRLFGAVHGMGRRKAVATGNQLCRRLGWRPRSGLAAAQLSGGTQQKLNVVLSELNSPDLILLDEPYQGFDQDSYLDFWDQVLKWRDAGAGVLVVTHLLQDLERVDHLVELHGSEDR